MQEISIRCEGNEFLNITLFGRSYPEASDSDDGNWISALIELRAGGFSGSASGYLRAEELTDFHHQFARLQESLLGSATFETMESWLSIGAKGDGCGHMEFQCTVRDRPGDGNYLEFTLKTDQTFTRKTVEELAAAVQAYPVVDTR